RPAGDGPAPAPRLPAGRGPAFPREPVPRDPPRRTPRSPTRALYARLRRPEARSRGHPREVFRLEPGRETGGRTGSGLPGVPRRRAPPEELVVLLHTQPRLQGAGGDLAPGACVAGRPGFLAPLAGPLVRRDRRSHRTGGRPVRDER